MSSASPPPQLLQSASMSLRVTRSSIKANLRFCPSDTHDLKVEIASFFYSLFLTRSAASSLLFFPELLSVGRHARGRKNAWVDLFEMCHICYVSEQEEVVRS